MKTSTPLILFIFIWTLHIYDAAYCGLILEKSDHSTFPFSIPTPNISSWLFQLAVVHPALFIHDDCLSQASKWSPCDEQATAAKRATLLEKAI